MTSRVPSPKRLSVTAIQTVTVLVLAIVSACSKPPPVKPGALDAAKTFYVEYFLGGGWRVHHVEIDPEHPSIIHGVLYVPNAALFDLDELHRLAEINACPHDEKAAGLWSQLGKEQSFVLEVPIPDKGSIHVRCRPR